MAESLTLTGEDDDETTEKDKKKSKVRSDSSSKIGASVLEKGPARGAEQPKMNPLDKLLASLLPEKDAKTKQNAKVEGIFAELGKANPETTTPESIELIKPTRELTSDELSGGEVIIDLRAEDSPGADEGELVVASQTTDAEAEPTAELTTTEEREDPVRATSTTSTTKPTAAGGSGGSRTPPPPRPTPSSSPPPRPIPPTSTTFAPVMSAPVPSANFNTAPAAGTTLDQLLEQRRALEQTEYYARRHGRAEGFLGGVILGGLVEHFRHKSRERRMDRLSKQEGQKQEKRLTGMEFQLKTEQLEQVRREEAAKYERKAAAKQELATVARAQMSEAEAIKHAREVTRTAEEQERDKAALIERLNAQATLQEQSEVEMLANSENHIEESAWHSIEVDKAGHAVQDTTIEYGHEYYQERGHESGPKDVTTRDSITGAAALTAATMAPQSTRDAQQPQAPFMVGLPSQPAASTQHHTDSMSDQEIASTGGMPHTSAAAVIFLLITLVVVGLLIFALM